MREAGARHTPPPPPCPCSRVRDLQCGRPRAVRLGALALITVTFATAYLCQVVAPGFVDPALGEWVRGGWLVPNPKRCYCSKRKAELTEPKNAYQRLRAHRAPPRVNHRTPPPPPPPPPPMLLQPSVLHSPSSPLLPSLRAPALSLPTCPPTLQSSCAWCSPSWGSRWCSGFCSSTPCHACCGPARRACWRGRAW